MIVIDSNKHDKKSEHYFLTKNERIKGPPPWQHALIMSRSKQYSCYKNFAFTKYYSIFLSGFFKSNKCFITISGSTSKIKDISYNYFIENIPKNRYLYEMLKN